VTNCLKGCIKTFQCEPLNLPLQDVDGSKDGPTMAPFVRAKFSNGKIELTVGNKSAPQRKNDAVIRSFEYGHTDGMELKFEVLDERGSIFNDFVNGLAKCAKNASSAKVKVEVTFGWIITDCFTGNHRVIETPHPLVSFPVDLDVNYAEGKIKYNITCKDPLNSLFGTREDCIEGSDDQKMHLEDAIRQICNKDPKCEVEFKRIEKNGDDLGNPISWEKGKGKGGPLDRWPAMSHDRLTTIRSWINKHPCEGEDPGVRIYMDTADQSGRKLLVVQSLDEGRKCQGFAPSLGTFIVNGGKCSNVLEFSPKMNWTGGFGAFGSGGGTGGPMSGKSSFKEKGGKSKVEEKHDNKDSCMSGGPQEAIVTDQTNQSVYGENAVEKTNKAERQHAEANRINEQYFPIEAELRIIGDPRKDYIDPTNKGALTCSIVAINPFHIRGSVGKFQPNETCGDWLARPGCNDVLTSRKWMVRGVNHSIKEGSYVTTLKLFLETPGITEEEKKLDPAARQELKNLCDGQ